ncbi:hypothetical protein KIW84_020926, partial [Lathyrus oleraceus]
FLPLYIEISFLPFFSSFTIKYHISLDFELSTMDSKKAFIILGFLAMVLFISSVVSARDLSETSTNTKEKVVEKSNEVNDAKYYGGGYGGYRGGYGGYNGGYGGYRGGYGGYNGGYGGYRGGYGGYNGGYGGYRGGGGGYGYGGGGGYNGGVSDHGN